MGRIERWRSLGDPASPPIVLVHGLGVSSRYLRPVATRLAETHHALAPDFPDEPEDVPGRASLLAAWLDEVGIERTPLLANSLGCQVAVELAVQEPRRVEALVLVGPTTDPAARSLVRQAARLLATAPFERPSLDALVTVEYLSHPLATLRTARRMLEHRMDERLRLVEAPVLVVRGRNDRIVPARWAEEAARLARGRLETLPGGHALNYTSPDELAPLVRAFLRS